mmetsp:Transcript_58723/g.168652  ORF Transcript_58723/g.168652 Transcript_58723/m.168652 type:complete len:249 (-) Transcript_58723:117-863(-)
MMEKSMSGLAFLKGLFFSGAFSDKKPLCCVLNPFVFGGRQDSETPMKNLGTPPKLPRVLWNRCTSTGCAKLSMSFTWKLSGFSSSFGALSLSLATNCMCSTKLSKSLLSMMLVNSRPHIELSCIPSIGAKRTCCEICKSASTVTVASQNRSKSLFVVSCAISSSRTCASTKSLRICHCLCCWWARSNNILFMTTVDTIQGIPPDRSPQNRRSTRPLCNTRYNLNGAKASQALGNPNGNHHRDTIFKNM